MENEFKNKRILVTGGTGSIGNAIIQGLLKYEPKYIRIYSRDETKQFELEHKLNAGDKVRFLIGDVRDKERLNLAMEDIDIVFHVAALKHVSACESNPFEAVKTNVQGTQNVIDCAFANKVDKVIGVSTDKATDPTSVMGCTKLLAEKIMLSTFYYKGHKKTKFCFVRFGNVLGSRGSVVPLLKSQIKAGKPVTVTDSKMTRFFMTINQAVELVFKAAQNMQDREIFVFKMPVVNIKDLAKALISLEQDKDASQGKIDIKIIGKKDGERMYERLLTKEEAENSLETKDMFIIVPKNQLKEVKARFKARKAPLKEYSSKNTKKLNINEIKKMLHAMDSEDSSQ